ncbi:uncharacterized protein N0V89_004311 [Didymosphaeria variabile]|uniref:Uncharacterized protein n=1 Tax=Didymosphaeria variabile TaxID=1932322 RepID=A0A9W8XP77_9PLEO|nr:uncharacterized protein N0V89_004311 [Didymosphaeria variabile]KAJ4356280.1 hypothetical protein N0V89_004311 [Didymosphaeria variabile]
MLHPRSSKERERARRVSDSAATQSEATVAPLTEEAGQGDDGTSDKRSQRIAELEQALATALEEQNMMREELVKLRDHGKVYKESIEEYRRILAGTYQLQSPPGAPHSDSRPASARSNSYEGENAPRKSTSQPREDLVEQNDSLRTQVAQLQDQLMTQDATYQSLLDQRRSRAEAEWDQLTARLHSTEKESGERLQQLLSLKSAFSSLTRVESQVTDSELSETFSQLFNSVREWVISNYRRAKVKFSDLPLDTAEILEAISPLYRTVDPANRLALFQALVSYMLMNIFQEFLFVGIPETGPLATLRQVASTIRSTGTGYQNWRHVTIRSLQESDAAYTIKEGKAHQRDLLASCILHHLLAITSTTPLPEARSALDSILSATMEFQNTLLLQKARYKVDFFRKQDELHQSVDDNRMEPINELDGFTDDDGDVVVDRGFVFCVFPSLEKFGDEYGEHTEVSNVLVRARVMCQRNYFSQAQKMRSVEQASLM